MANYLRQQTIGSILRDAVEIYRRHFGVIFLTYLLPVFPIAVWQSEAQASHNTLSTLLALVCAMVASLVATGAITLCVSEICLGNKPSVMAAYQKVLGRMMGTLFLASLLQLLIILVGFMLLVVPGIIFMLWLLFTPSVVVLEGLGAIGAMKRSKALAQGFLGRNLGVFIMVIILCALLGGLLGIILGMVLPKQEFFFRLTMTAAQSMATPLTLIAVVLMYYDLRVRKEAYDAAMLAEDLRR